MTRFLAAALCLLAGPVLAATQVAYTAADNISAVPVSTKNPLPVSSGGGAPYAATPDGYQQVSVTTATGFTPPAGAAYCYLITEGNAIRYRTDNTNPTASVGMPLAVGNQLLLSITSLTAFAMISQSGTATVDIDCYQ